MKAGGAAAWEVGEGEDTEAVRLQRAHALIRSQDAEMSEVRARNASLAERLIQLAKGGGGDGGGDKGGDTGGGGGGASQADIEAAVAAMAEKNKARVVQLEAKLADAATAHAAALETARAEAAEARAAAAKHEESLQSLSEAYNGLETDIYTHEEAERTLKAQLAAMEERAVSAERTGGGGGEASAEALAAVREEGYQQGKEEAAGKAEAARAEGAAEAEAAGEAEMNDLLVCLGQEESKVEVLREKLEGMGVDVEELLATVGVEEEDEEGEEEA